MQLREAVQQAIMYAKWINEEQAIISYGQIMNLRAALSDTKDWDEIKALRASLREHMAEIHRLRVAGRQALEALENDPVLANAKNNATAWLRAALTEDVPETKFGNMAQAVDSTEADHIPDATKMEPTSQESRQVKPVAWSYTDARGRLVLVSTNTAPYEDAKPLYSAPPKREPLTEEEISAIDWKSGETLHDFARAIERAHGIGGEE